MSQQPSRGFTIADMMIFVVAAAVATLILRNYMPGHYRQLASIPNFRADSFRIWWIYSWISGPGSVVVLSLMAALIPIRFQNPRPRWRRLVFQPGFVACLAVMVGLVPGLLWYLTIRARPGFQRADFGDQSWLISTAWVNTAVIGSWVALALKRRWCPEPSWIDRMGRVLGLYWIVCLVWLLGFEALEKLLNFLSRT